MTAPTPERPHSRPPAPRPAGPGGRLLAWAAIAGAAGGLLGVLTLLLVHAVGAFADNAARWLPYPFPRPGSEGLMLYETIFMRQGGDLYGPITPDQFISGPYPPVYYWLAGRLMPETPGFIDGRGLSLWAGVAAAVLAGLAVWGVVAARSRAPRGAAHAAGLGAGLVAGGCWLAAPPVLIWATRFRADMLMMALMAAGLTCVAVGAAPGAAPRGWRAALVWLAVPCFVLALYTKQTALAGPLAAGAYLLVQDPRRGLRWGLGLLLLGGVPFAVLDLATGHWFYLKMVDYHSLPWSAGTFTRLLQAWQEDHLLLILAALGYAGWTIIRRRNDLLTWYLAACLALLPTAGVVGADHNHLLAVDLALVLATGAGLGQTAAALLAGAAAALRGPARPRAAALLGPAVTGTLLVTACAGYLAMAAAPADWYAVDFAMPSDAQQTQLHKIVAFIAQAPPGPYLADDPGLLALAGKTTPYDDLFTVTALAAAGRWNPSVLEVRLREGAFPYVFLAGDVTEPPHVPLRADILTPDMRAALRTGYQVLFADVFFTYAPRP